MFFIQLSFKLISRYASAVNTENISLEDTVDNVKIKMSTIKPLIQLVLLDKTKRNGLFVEVCL